MSGSVPDSRTTTQRPPSKSSLRPSSVSAASTLRRPSFGGRVLDEGLQLLDPLRRQRQGPLAAGHGPVLLEQVVAQGPEAPAGRGDHLGDEQAGEDAVLFGQVVLDGDAGALLAAEHDPALQVELGDVLEADLRLHQRQVVLAGDAVEEVGRRDRAGHPAAPALDLDEIAEQQGQDDVRVDEAALLVDDPEAVPVGVGGQPEVAAGLEDMGLELGQVLLGAGGADAAEVGIDIAVEAFDLDAVLLEDLVEILAAGAEERVGRDLEAGLADDPEIDLALEMGEVIGLEVDAGNGLVQEVGRQGGEAGHEPADLLFDGVGHLGQGRRACRGVELEAVVARRIERGGEVDPALAMALDDLAGQGLGGRVAVGQQDLDPVPGQELGRLQGVTVRQEAGVVADDHRDRVVPVLGPEVVGDGLDDDADVVEGEFLTHHPAPAGGAESDHHRPKTSTVPPEKQRRRPSDRLGWQTLPPGKV